MFLVGKLTCTSSFLKGEDISLFKSIWGTAGVGKDWVLVYKIRK